MKQFKALLICLLAATYTYGQSELPKFAPNPDKVKVKLDMPLEGRAYKNGTGYALNPKMLEKLPEKVALVSFYTFDPGFTHTYTTSTTTGNLKITTTTTKKRNSAGNAGAIALGFYYETIDMLINKFADMGMQLMEPDEFLDTDEKKTFYNNYVMERSKFNTAVSNLLNNPAGHATVYANPDNYRVIPVDNEPFANYTKKGLFPIYKAEVADGQLWTMAKVGKEVSSLNTLTEALGVDAILFVYSTIYVPKQSEIHLQNVNMLMFGKNPVALPEGKTSKFNYFPGQMYIGTRVNVGVPIMKIHKKKPETAYLDFTGYANIMEAMVNRMDEYFTKAFSKKK